MSAECISKVANWSHVKAHQLFDKPYAFIPEDVVAKMPLAGPKLRALLDKVAELDAADMNEHGHMFKHFVFSGQKNANYGIKIVASAFAAEGYGRVFDAADSGLLKHKSDDALMADGVRGNSMTLLASKPLFGKPMTSYFKKRTLELFNQRPENVHGDLARFIVLDGGFREGIDLFDVKYVHLLEPTPIHADEKQAIGRATRFCGQKGLTFSPTRGWPLFVFKYDVLVNDATKASLGLEKERPTFLDLELKYSDIDVRQVVFAAALEETAIDAAVDKGLTKAVHEFKMAGGALALMGRVAKSGVDKIPAPSQIMNLKGIQTFVANHYMRFAYPAIKLQNGCISGGMTSRALEGGMLRSGTMMPSDTLVGGMTSRALEGGMLRSGTMMPSDTLVGGAGPTSVEFSPSQDFVRHFFTADSAYKGMLLFHGVGVGKTCTAIATASSSFEQQGYTILWVTRHTLKQDIWKNMLRQVCSMSMRERLANGKKVAKTHVPENWIEPISYKTFSNMLLKKNKTYANMVQRNGSIDPLRKTLIIIDEAHKLYAPSTPASEKPNSKIMESMIQKSYELSGDDSVRILAMTATPFTEKGFEMIQLMNLLRKDKLPTTFEDFSSTYLADDGNFTKEGRLSFMDAIAGYVSYLNRSTDARNFAYPILENVLVPMTNDPVSEPFVKKNRFVTGIKDIGSSMKEKMAESKMVKQECKTKAATEYKAAVAAAAKEKADADVTKAENNAECMKLAPKPRAECKKKVKMVHDIATTNAKTTKETATEAKKVALEACEGLDSGAAEVSDLEKKLEALKAEYDAIKKQKKDITEESKHIVEELSSLFHRINDNKNKIKLERQNIKRLPIEERKARRQAMKEDYAKQRELVVASAILRQRQQRLNKKKVLISENIGTREAERVSQETKLNDKCALNGQERQQSSQPRPEYTPTASAEVRVAEERRLRALKPTLAEFSAILEKDFRENPQGAKKTYLKLTLKYHPDKHPNSNKADYEYRFKNLQQAWGDFKMRYNIRGGFADE